MGRKKQKKQQSGLDDLFAEYMTDETDEQEEEYYDKDATALSIDGSGAVMIRISLVEPNPDQPRKDFDDEALGELADSIKQHGILQPLLVRQLDNDVYQIVAGERRWRAARKAGLKSVPVIIKSYTDREMAEVALIENIQRQDLNPLEEANAYRVLMDEYSMTQEQLAERLGKSRAAVANTVRFLNLQDDVKTLLSSGQISAGHAVVLLAVSDPRMQAEIAERIAVENLSVRETEELIKAFRTSERKTKTAVSMRNYDKTNYEALEKRLREILTTKVRIVPEMMPGQAVGTVTRQKISRSLIPSVRPA